MTAEQSGILQRILLPRDEDPQILTLYVEPEQRQSKASEYVFASGSARPMQRYRSNDLIPSSASTLVLDPPRAEGSVLGRGSFSVAAESSASFATYFNAFPAAYWAHWTPLRQVALEISTRGTGVLRIHRSAHDGTATLVSEHALDGADAATTRVELSLDGFDEGGWLWFALDAAAAPLELLSGAWTTTTEVRDPSYVAGTASLAVTTMDRVDDVLNYLHALADDPEVLSLLDRVYVVDQGRSKVRDSVAFAEAEARLGGRLTVIDQANLGGSGGFSRGMAETLEREESRYVLLSDDDIVVEPESLRRLIVFANHAGGSTLVGGHMFNLQQKATLYTVAEGFEDDIFDCGPITPLDHDFTESSLRDTPWLHHRHDAQYNAWWLCLVPVAALRQIGLSLPLFLRWDDAEYGYRAGESGFPTVSLPGAGVWHPKWTGRDEAMTWRGFYNVRNRTIAALCHSPYADGALVMPENRFRDFTLLLRKQYLSVAIRIEGYRSILAGPDALHDDAHDRLAKLGEIVARYPDGDLITGEENFPPIEIPRGEVHERHNASRAATGLARQWWFARQLAKNLFVPSTPGRYSRASIRFSIYEARWWVTPDYDSFLVDDGPDAVRWYRRDRGAFVRLLWESWRVRRRLTKNWAKLAAEYRAALPRITSAERWRETFETSAG